MRITIVFAALAGDYTIQDSNDCINSATGTFQVVDRDCLTRTRLLHLEKVFHCFPNPPDGVLTFDLSGWQLQVEVDIRDGVGRTIHQGQSRTNN